VINSRQRKEIYAIVKEAEILNFRPLLYVIPFSPVAKRAISVPIHERAHPFSIEYIIENLSRKSFDVIEYRIR
jgi:hypothetical protein